MIFSFFFYYGSSSCSFYMIMLDRFIVLIFRSFSFPLIHITRPVLEFCSCIAIRVCFICVFWQNNVRHTFVSYLMLTFFFIEPSCRLFFSILFLIFTLFSPLFCSSLLNSSAPISNNKKQTKWKDRYRTSESRRNITRHPLCEHAATPSLILDHI